MMFRLVFTITVVFGLTGPLAADPVSDVMATARESFDRMPTLAIVDQIEGACGADGAVNRQVAYCTTTNSILIVAGSASTPQTTYLVAHLLGHAVQVQHGVADVALRTIRQRPAEEQTLRGYVEGQVDCIAGFLFARAGMARGSLLAWFAEDPFASVHWGRDPLRVGPRISVDLETRDGWFQTGQAAGTLANCAVGDFGADLLLRAYKG